MFLNDTFILLTMYYKSDKKNYDCPTDSMTRKIKSADISLYST